MIIKYYFMAYFVQNQTMEISNFWPKSYLNPKKETQYGDHVTSIYLWTKKVFFF